MRKGIPFVGLLLAILAAVVLTKAQPPTAINSTDLLVNSRQTINTNFSNLYTQAPGLVDCSATTGSFVVTLVGGGVASTCGTLTWAEITQLSGFPGGFVFQFNSRTGSVTLQSSDVASVEQDLRNTASPNFNSLGLGGHLTVTGYGTFTGLVSATGGLLVTGAPTSCSAQPTGTIANVSGTATFCP